MRPLALSACIGQSESVEVDFAQLRDDGTVDARLGPEWPIFNEALADSISSLPPRGSAEKHLSTYWIDKTLERLRGLQQRNVEGRIASGNAYGIVFSSAGISAVFDYGDEDTTETMDLGDFTDLLERWRARVIEVQQHEEREVPETYRRNPWP